MGYRAWMIGLLGGLLLLSSGTYGQSRVMTVGGQFMPMLPSGFFNAREVSSVANGVEYTTSQQFGYAAGLIIRKGFTKRFSLETGLRFVQRNFNLSIDSLDNGFTSETNYRLVGYEIPVTGLVYVQLDQRWFMSVAMGASIDMFPSDVLSATEEGWIHETVRESWIQLALLTNLGFEYRTEKSGTFYFGGSFHRPFTDMYLSKIGLADRPLTETSQSLNGIYLSLDFRYFFHEDPEKRKVRTQNKQRNKSR